MSKPFATESNARPRHRWLLILGCLLGGALLGVVSLTLAPLWSRSDSQTPALAGPVTHVGGASRKDGPKVGGSLFTTIKEFTLEDPEGNMVLKVAKIGGFLDLDSFGDARAIRMPRGKAEDVELLLRRGPSGRVSLSEAFRGNSEPHEPKKGQGGMPLNIGPLEVTNVKMTVAMGKTPIIIHIDRAIIRVQRKVTDLAPRIFLSEVHGHMAKPDPLPQPIAIEGASGVVDLAGDPLVDLRARVCIGDSEMRIRIEMPERREKVQLTVDAFGPAATSALVALNAVSLFKSDKIGVGNGAVAVDEPFKCTRERGEKKRSRMDAVEHAREGGNPDGPMEAEAPSKTASRLSAKTKVE